MKTEKVAARTINEAILLAVSLAESTDRDVEPSSFLYMGEEGGLHTLWYASYPKEDRL